MRTRRVDDLVLKEKGVERGWRRWFSGRGRSEDNHQRPYQRLAMELYFDLGQSGQGVCLMLTCPSWPMVTAQATLDLAEYLAQDQGRHVLIVDAVADVEPLSRYFDLTPKAPGLLNLLADETLTLDSVVKTTPAPRLHIMSAGEVEKGHRWLLTSERIGEKLTLLRRHYEFVLLNSSSILEDPSMLAFPSVVDCVLLLGVSGVTKRPELIDCRKTLQRSKAGKTGLLLVRLK